MLDRLANSLVDDLSNQSVSAILRQYLCSKTVTWVKTLVAAETSGYAGAVAGLFLDRYFKNTKQEVRGGAEKKFGGVSRVSVQNSVSASASVS